MIRHSAVLLLATALAGSAFPARGAAQTVDPAGAASAEGPYAALVPDTVIFPSGGPRIVLLTAPGEGVAALRLAVPLREGPAEAGAGWLLKELALERMQTLARPVGAEVAAIRTPWGVAYSVVGAAADFEFLAYLLRQAVEAPDVEAPAFIETRLRLREAAARGVETPSGRVAAELRAQAAPGIPPALGSPGSLQAMDGALVRQVWLRSHQASGMTLVVSAPVVPEVVLAATRGMGAPEESAMGPLDALAPRAGRGATATQALRTWYGEAWQAMPTEDPHGPVVALLASEALRAQAVGFEVSLELWELPDRWVLAVVGGAYGRDVAPMRRAVSGTLTQVRDRLTAAEVRRAVSRVQGDLLLRSRTPAGLVSWVGRAMEAGGDPRAAADGLLSLSRVDEASTRAFVESLLTRGPVRAEVRP